MAMDMFILFPAESLKGESKDKKYGLDKGGIDVLAWSWGMSNSGSFHTGGGGGAGKANVQDLSFTKYIDKASPGLMLACLKGTHIDDAKLIVRKAGDTPLEYVEISLTEVLVAAVSTGGSGGEDRLTENVSLNFAKVNFIYRTQDKAGAKGKEPAFTFDIAQNVSE